jgi:RNA polymerase sigma-70 factor (ECF subfamily)
MGSVRPDLGQLMARYVDGDPSAFGPLHRALEPGLTRQVRARISDPELAREIVQSVFVKAHRARERFATPEGGDPDRAVKTWYASITRNATIDAIRKLYRERGLGYRVSGPAEDPEGLGNLPSPIPTIEAQLSDAERRAAIRAIVREAVASLPDRQREVVELHKLQGLSMREISQRVGVREGTLRVRAHRAYKALGEVLKTTMAERPELAQAFA